MARARPDTVLALRSRYGRDELLARLRKASVAVFDVDECLSDGFTQARLARCMAFRLLAGAARRPAGLLSFLRLARAGRRLRRVERQDKPRPEKNALRQAMFLEACQGIPLRVFRLSLGAAWRGLRPDAAAALVEIAAVMPAGVASLGFDIVLRQLPDEIRRLTGQPWAPAFLEANVSLWQDGRFAGAEEPIRTTAEHKVELYRRGAGPDHLHRALLAVGHGADEAGLCRLARETGGLSVAVGAQPEEEGFFDVLLPPGGWTLLAELVREAFPRAESPGPPRASL